MSNTEDLIAVIEDAFKDVVLDDGIGLLEADGIDDRKSNDELAALRAQDEKNDWKSMSDDYIGKGWCSIHFYDPKGMRFYLPAYMIADIKGNYKNDLYFALIELDQLSKKHQFSLFNAKQRNAVKLYLEYYIANDSCGYKHDEVRNSITSFWGA